MACSSCGKSRPQSSVRSQGNAPRKMYAANATTNAGAPKVKISFGNRNR